MTLEPKSLRPGPLASIFLRTLVVYLLHEGVAQALTLLVRPNKLLLVPPLHYIGAHLQLFIFLLAQSTIELHDEVFDRVAPV